MEDDQDLLQEIFGDDFIDSDDESKASSAKKKPTRSAARKAAKTLVADDDEGDDDDDDLFGGLEGEEDSGDEEIRGDEDYKGGAELDALLKRKKKRQRSAKSPEKAKRGRKRRAREVESESESESDEERERGAAAGVELDSDEEELARQAALGISKPAAQPKSKSKSKTVRKSKSDEPKKRAKKSTTGAKKSRRSRSHEEDSGAGIGALPGANVISAEAADSDNDAEVKEEDEVDRALRLIKEQKKQRRGATELDIIEIDDISSGLLAKMRAAAEADRASIRTGAPALQKLALCSEVMRRVRHREFQGALLDGGLIAVLDDWLAPISEAVGGPSGPVVRTVLEAMAQYRCTEPREGATTSTSKSESTGDSNDRRAILTSSHLRSAPLARRIRQLVRDTTQPPEIRRLAATLVQRWARMVFGLDADYRNAADYDAEKIGRVLNTASATHNIIPHDPNDVIDASRARMPQRPVYDYAIRPEADPSVLQHLKKRGGGGGPEMDDGSRRSVERKMEQMHRSASVRTVRSGYRPVPLGVTRSEGNR